MIRDRGNIKWTAMMIPEHVVALRKWMEQDNYILRHELSGSDLQSIQVWDNGRIIQHPEMCILTMSPFGSERMLVVNIINAKIVK